jgi:hypothetical protein
MALFAKVVITFRKEEVLIMALLTRWPVGEDDRWYEDFWKPLAR